MKAMQRHMGARPRSTDRSIDAFEGQPRANDPCGEALFDTLFDRAQATNHAADQDRRGLLRDASPHRRQQRGDAEDAVRQRGMRRMRGLSSRIRHGYHKGFGRRRTEWLCQKIDEDRAAFRWRSLRNDRRAEEGRGGRRACVEDYSPWISFNLLIPFAKGWARTP
jgi:hypothetical protein